MQGQNIANYKTHLNKKVKPINKKVYEPKPHLSKRQAYLFSRDVVLVRVRCTWWYCTVWNDNPQLKLVHRVAEWWHIHTSGVCVTSLDHVAKPSLSQAISQPAVCKQWWKDSEFFIKQKTLDKLDNYHGY